MIWWVIVSVLVIVVLGYVSLKMPPGRPSEYGEHTVATHHAWGQYRVLYPDGQLSQPFLKGAAEDYREMFGGTIVPRDYQPPPKSD